MDIIDVILGSALAPQGQISTYATLAQQAVLDANAAIDNINTITEQTNSNNEAAIATMEEATQALTKVNTAADKLEEMMDSLMPSTDLIHSEVDKLLLSMSTSSNGSVVATDITTTYPDNSVKTLNNVVKYYTTTGNNEDGTMTQKAITAAVKDASVNLGAGNSGKMVKIGADGKLTASSIKESDILNGEIIINPDHPTDPTIPPVDTSIIGMKINYQTSTYEPTNAAAADAEEAFNKSLIYGGRKRCLVDNDGQIIAFYGQAGYTDTPTDGKQIMVYQPKFYYKRVVSGTKNVTAGTAITEETIRLSTTAQDGYKVHPVFINENGDEIDYVLLSAYEGSIESNEEDSYQDRAYTNFTSQKLASVPNAKPISGANNRINAPIAETLAANRGEGWHIMNIKALSAEQMLELVEFGAMNSQTALGNGIVSITNVSNAAQAATTGSTISLGNQTGSANETTFNFNNETHTQTDGSKVAITYRGVENQWGNLWKYVGGILIQNVNSSTHKIYICNNFNYSTEIADNYSALSYNLTRTSGWISAMGFDNNYDWLFLPVETGNSASSIAPVGDYVYATSNSSGIQTCLFGGQWLSGLNAGLFSYAFDMAINSNGYRMTGARTMYVPNTSNQYYTSNKAKWATVINGGA